MFDDKSQEQAQQLALDIMTEYHPLDSHEKWQSVLRTVSRMSTKPDIKPIDRSLLNTAYTLIKQKYREYERMKSIGMPKSYGGRNR